MRIRGRRRGSGRYVATVLFVDIAGSTERAAEIGDAAWRDLLGRYYSIVRENLRRFGGREIDTAGDGLFAVFDAPAEAIGCAFAVRDRAAILGLEVRSGLHMGEVQSIQGKAGGIAVHIGARIAAAAAPGDVLVSSTVKDLVAGSGVRFENRGEADLKGVPGRWRLFAASPPVERPAEAHIGEASGGARSALPLPTAVQGRAIVAIAVVVLVAGTAGAFNLLQQPGATLPTATASQERSSPSSIPIGADSVGRMDATGRVVATGDVGALPDGIAVAAGSLWVANTTDDTVTRLDGATTRAIQTIHVGASPSDVVSGFGAIWVANSGGRTVSRIDPTVNDVVATITVGISPTRLALGGKWIWVTNRLDGSISRIDPDTAEVMHIPAGQTPVGIAEAAGAIWVSDFDGGTVIRIEEGTGAAGAPIHVGNGPAALAASADAVWVANTRDGTVSRIDPGTSSVRATIPVGDEPSDLAAASDAVWVAVSSTSEVVRIDPATGAVSRFPVGASPQGVALDGEQPVFTARATETSHRGGTLRLVSSPEGFPTSLDPAFNAFGSISTLTNDALVAYKQTGGPDGSTLVPDLATSLPIPTDGGRTYTFRLRSGIVYSTGRPVRASDVRRSIERAQASAQAGLTGTFSRIVGADQCQSDKPCDLSKSILVDDQAGTVTFHLSEADPNFLYTLAWVNGAILPADTPDAESTTPLPATGPYMLDVFSKDRLRLVRNPMFHEWSRAAQPDGYPDVIEWTVAPTAADASAMVEKGDADVLVDTVPPERLAALATQIPAQLHVAPGAETFFEMMNTRIAPFDDVRVRRAVAFALDRQAAVDAYGGPLQGRITCQVVPPTFAGYDPYCPYTVLPDASGSWKGPDLATARSLIDQAGVKGQAVTVYGLDLPGHDAVARYFTKLLESLGFKASTKLLSLDAMFAPPNGAVTHPSDVQVAGFWYFTQPPTASTMITGTFTCPDFPSSFGYTGYPTEFCDRDLDAQVTNALALDQTGDRSAANALWAQIDRRIVDAAPAAALFNPTDVTLVSRRVGNFQHHPAWLVLLDQLWVQ